MQREVPVDLEMEREISLRGKSMEHRGTAMLDYHDFLPSHKRVDKLLLAPTQGAEASLPVPPLPSLISSQDAATTREEDCEQKTSTSNRDLTFALEGEADLDEDMVWEINPARGD
jgi:hypothetical protein